MLRAQLGYFTFFRSNWTEAEGVFYIDWHSPHQICYPGFGYVEAHTTFTLKLFADDLERLADYSGLITAAEKWTEPGKLQRFSSENLSETPERTLSKQGCYIFSTEEEAWEAIARKESQGRYQKLRHHRLDQEASYLEEVITSEASYPLCTTCLSSQEGRQELSCDMRLALKTCIFHSIMKVPWVENPRRRPLYLSVVVSQWHECLIVRCYDFLSGETKEAARPDSFTDAFLVKEFKTMTKEARNIQLQVLLADLVVCEVAGGVATSERTEEDEDISRFQHRNPASIDDSHLTTENRSDESSSKWGVKFVEEGADPILLEDGGVSDYTNKVDAEMLAAAVQVRRRRESAQMIQNASREKDRRARENREAGPRKLQVKMDRKKSP